MVRDTNLKRSCEKEPLFGDIVRQNKCTTWELSMSDD
jgi:hypothetical protein